MKSLCDKPLGEWVFKFGCDIFHGQVLHRSTQEREHLIGLNYDEWFT